MVWCRIIIEGGASGTVPPFLKIQGGFMRKKKINITLQYVLSYCVVIVVTALLVFCMVEWILLQYRQTLVNNVKASVHSYMDELDAELLKQQKLAQEIFSDELTAPENITAHPLQTVQGMKQLELYKNSLPLNDYIFLKYPGYDELILQSGTISMDSFVRYELQLVESSKAFLVDMLEDDSGADKAVLLGNKDKNVIVWTYPFRNSFSGRMGMVCFGSYGSTWGEYLENVIREMPFYAVMVSDDGKILFEINKLSYVSQQDAINIRKLILKGKETSVKGYTMDVCDSVNGFSLSIALEDDYILSDFNKIVNTVLIIGFVIFVVSLILVIFVNSIHVRKIKSIRDGLLGLEKTEDALNVNEFSQIQNLIERLYNEQVKRTEERTYLNKTMSELIVKLLLSGKIGEKKYMLRELVANFCPELQCGYYGVIGVVAAESCENFKERLRNRETFIVCFEEHQERSDLFYIVINLGDKDEAGNQRKKLLEELVREADTFGVRNLFAVAGNIYENLYELNTSYREVLLLINYLLCCKEQITEKVFIFNRVIEELIHTGVQFERLQALEQTLVAGTLEQASLETQQFFIHSFKGKKSVDCAFEIYLLAGVFEKLFRKTGCDEMQLRKLKEGNFESREELKRFVLKLISSKKTVSVEDILAYIQANYKDNTMGLDTLAAHFSMSVSNLSHKIKDSIGENYSDYIYRVRIEEACRLLRETNISVRDIVSEVGYSDYSSFSRKFKSKMGLTLKEYRDRYSEEEKDEELQ